MDVSSHCDAMQPGAVYATQSLKFAAPVYVGDVVVGQVQALHIKATGASHMYCLAPLHLLFSLALCLLLTNDNNIF